MPVAEALSKKRPGLAWSSTLQSGRCERALGLVPAMINDVSALSANPAMKPWLENPAAGWCYARSAVGPVQWSTERAAVRQRKRCGCRTQVFDHTGQLAAVRAAEKAVFGSTPGFGFGKGADIWPC